MPGQPEHPEPHLPEGLPADWRYPHDLPCPSCAYNLRMQREPRCPECGLRFRWQQVLAVDCPRCGEALAEASDAKCPQCDLPLEWERLLGEIDPQQLRQFEYAPRPWLAAASASFRVLQPRRFWGRMKLHWFPITNRLQTLRLLAVCVCLAGLVALLLANRRVYWRLSDPDLMADSATLATAMLLFPLVTTLMLPIFAQTLNRFRIRRDQTLRISAYGFLGVAWAGALLLIAAGLLAVYNWSSGPMFRGSWFFSANLALDPPRWVSWRLGTGIPYAFSVGVLVPVAVIGALWWTYFLRVALNDYLRLDKREARALFSSITVVTCLAAACLLIICTDAAYPIGGWLLKLWP